MSHAILLSPMCPVQRHLTSHTGSLEVLTLLHVCEPYIHIGVFPTGFGDIKIIHKCFVNYKVLNTCLLRSQSKGDMRQCI